MVRAATPPTTPPAIAPVFEVELSDSEFLFDDGRAEVVFEAALEEEVGVAVVPAETILSSCAPTGGEPGEAHPSL